MNRVFSHLTTVVALLIAPSAQAEDLARKHQRRAIEHIQHGDHRAAIMEFEEVYAASHKPNALFNIAAEYKAASQMKSANDLRRAVEYYERYLKERGDAPDRAEVEDVAAELRRVIASLEPPPRGKEPPPPVLTPAASKPAEEPPVKTSPPPETSNPSPKNPALAPHPVAEPPRPASSMATPTRSRGRLPGGVLLGVGGALAVAGGILLGFAPGQQKGAPMGSTLQDFYNQKGAAHDLQLAGGILAGVGVAAALAGILLVALPEKREQPVSLWLAPTAGGLVAGGAF